MCMDGQQTVRKLGLCMHTYIIKPRNSHFSGIYGVTLTQLRVLNFDDKGKVSFFQSSLILWNIDIDTNVFRMTDQLFCTNAVKQRVGMSRKSARM